MSKKIEALRAELQEEKDKNQQLEQLRAQEAAAMQAEEERRKNKPIAMEEYYNIAYAKERQRLDEMFGRINYSPLREPQEPQEPIVKKEIVYKEKRVEVPVKDKKSKRLAGFFLATTIIFLATTVVLAIHSFVQPLF